MPKTATGQSRSVLIDSIPQTYGVIALGTDVVVQQMDVDS